MEKLLIDALSKLNQLSEHRGSKANSKQVNDDYLMNKRNPEGPPEDIDSSTKLTGPKVVDYKYVITEKNEIDSAKFFRNPVQLGSYLSGDDRSLLQSENFQSKFTREYPRILWDTEKLEDIGDFVLLFPNPDARPSSSDGKGVRLDAAEDYFDSIFDSRDDLQPSFKRALKKAFIATVAELDEIVPNSSSEGEGRGFFQSVPGLFSGGKQIASAAVACPNPALPLNTEASPLVAKDSLPASSLAAVPVGGALLNGSQTNGVFGANSSIIGENQQSGPTKDAANATLDERTINKQEKAKMRRVWKGGMYRPPEAVEGQKDDKIHNSAQWIREEPSTRDLHTLMRRCVLAALAQSGFVTREVFVDKGESIAVVIIMPEDNLKVVAQKMGLLKPVDLGLSDLLSFEPIDSLNRPLRLHHNLRSENSWKAAYSEVGMTETQKKQIIQLRVDINQLQDECNFKKLCRMAGCAWTEQEDDESNSSNIRDPAKVSIGIWLEYRDYLTRMSLHLKEIELLKEKLLYLMNTYYNPDRIAMHKNVPKSRLVRQDIFKITNHMIINAFKDALQAYPTLDCFWTALDKKPTEYIYQYRHSDNKMRPRNREALDRLWSEDMFTFPHNKKHFAEEAAKLVTQKTPFQRLKEFAVEYPGQAPNIFEILYESEQLEVYSSLFSKVERLKIVDFAINRVIDVSQLSVFFSDMKKLQGGFIGGLSVASSLADQKVIMFPLHDRRLTLGLNYSDYFAKLKHLKKLYDTMLVTKLQVKLQYSENMKFDKPVKQFTEQSVALSQDSIPSEWMQDIMQRPDLSATKPVPLYLHISPNSELASPRSGIQAEFSILKPNFDSPSQYVESAYSRQQSKQGRVTERSYGSATASARKLRGFDDTSATSILKARDRLVAYFKSLNRFSRFSSTYLAEIVTTEEDCANPDEGVVVVAGEGRNTTLAPSSPESKQRTNQLGAGSKTITQQSTNTNNSNQMEAETEVYEKQKAFSGLYKEIVRKYRIPDERLVDAVLQSFMTSIDLKSVLLPEFHLLGIETFQSERALSLHYPLKQSFEKSITFTPASNAESTIVNYFGEKIGLYFAFVQHFQASTLRISIEGCLITLFDMLYLALGNPHESLNTLSGANDQRDYYLKLLYIMLKVYFAIRATTWGTKFLQKWEQTESDFIARNGGSAEEELQIRPKFRGTWRRNIATDRMDEHFESPRTGMLKQTVIYIILFLSVIGALVSSFAILFIKRKWCRDRVLDRLLLGRLSGLNYMDQVFWNLVEIARAIGSRLILVIAAKRLVNWRNHKYKQDHEADLIFMISTYSLVNNSTVGLIIGFDVVFRTSYRIDQTTGKEIFFFQPNYECVYPSCSTEFSVYLILSKLVQIVYKVVLEFIIYRLGSYLVANASKVYKEIVGSCCKKKPSAKNGKYAKKTNSAQKPLSPELSGANSANSQIGNEVSPVQSAQDRRGLHIRQEDEDLSKISKESPHRVSKTLQKMTDDAVLIDILAQKNLKPQQVVQEVNKSILRNVTADPERYYKHINHEIHEQTLLRDGGSSGEVDPTLEPYLSLVSAVFLCCCFGVVLPFNFAASFAVCAVERYLESNKLARKEKRPVPETAAPLRLWKQFIQAVVSLSYVSSAFYVAFVVLLIDGTPAKFVIFIGLLGSTAVISSLLASGLPSVTEATSTFAERMKFVKDYIFPSKAALHEITKKQDPIAVSVSLGLFGLEIEPTDMINKFEAAVAADAIIEQREREAADVLDRKRVAESCLR